MTKLIKLDAVKEMTTLSKSTIYVAMRDGKFPKPIVLVDRSVAWVESEIQEWIETRLKEGRSGYKI